MSQKALEGVKIADFTWAAAGPLTMSYMAHCGATVVKIESGTRSIGARTFPPPGGEAGMISSIMFSNDNSDKLSITINMKEPKGVEVAKKLIEWADVVAENFRPGTMEKWGLGYEELKEINPSIIMFRSSARGQTGPDAHVAENGITLQSQTGFTYLTGWPDMDYPTPPWGAFTDLTAPALGAVMLIGALDYRARTGKGQCLDLSQFEAGLQYLAPALLDYDVNKKCAGRIGNSSSCGVPHGVYQCSGDDRWCTIAVFNDTEWRALCNVMKKPELIEDQRFATAVSRKKNEQELDNLISDWTMKHAAEEVMTRLQEQGVSSGVVENSYDIMNDPQIKDRKFFKQLEHKKLGAVTHHGVGFTLSKTPCEVQTPGPLLGQHTEYVCKELLGIDEEEFRELADAGALE
ncbi:MAG: CoA transferase [Deltaproteobacteria bacterium]|nr:CoA transferase [Deltaproteobacteria bacterium]